MICSSWLSILTWVFRLINSLFYCHFNPTKSFFNFTNFCNLWDVQMDLYHSACSYLFLFSLQVTISFEILNILIFKFFLRLCYYPYFLRCKWFYLTYLLFLRAIDFLTFTKILVCKLTSCGSFTLGELFPALLNWLLRLAPWSFIDPEQVLN